MAEVYFLKNLPDDWVAHLPNCIFDEEMENETKGGKGPHEQTMECKRVITFASMVVRYVSYLL